MGEMAIEADRLGKKYFLGENTSRDRFRQALQAVALKWLAPPMREFWALRDFSVSIKQGDVIGIIGRNGAGKSTLLKILSRVTKPTEGRATMRGRVGTLLEVGTGFHPELTGRDNVFLSGTILGMTYREVQKKFDEIVAFAELNEFIDTPVKRYSSGMYVRLAFAVASYLDPDILIVDEVLAVGDAPFQRKSLGHLNETSSRQGRTVLFVSHNLQSIRTFCRRVLVLERGRLLFDGPTDEGISRYLKSIPREIDVRNVGMKNRLNRTNGAVRFTKVSCIDPEGRPSWQVESGGSITLQFGYEVINSVPDMMFLMQIRSAGSGDVLTYIRQVISERSLESGRTGLIELSLLDVPLRPNELSLYACFARTDNRIAYDVVDENVDLPFLRVTTRASDTFDRLGVISVPYRFSVAEN
jgi:lipopolysaccharide transport system ATP-binding protein